VSKIRNGPWDNASLKKLHPMTLNHHILVQADYLKTTLTYARLINLKKPNGYFKFKLSVLFLMTIFT